MNSFFTELFEYNRQRNVEMADYCALNEGAISERAIKLYSHNLNAHHIWNHRVLKTSHRYGVWDLHIINSWDSIDHHNFETTLGIINAGRMDEILKYQDSKGTDYENKIMDLLYHILNHTNYHRAQIVTELRAAGLSPGKTDYIYYKR